VSTMQGAESLGPLPPPLDYIQPELIAPPHLPVPRSIGGVQPLDTVERSPQLFDELSMEALMRHSSKGGKGDTVTPAKEERSSQSTATAERPESPDEPIDVKVHH